MTRSYLGKHVIAEFYKCNPLTLNNSQAVEKIMTEAAVISGVNIIHPFFHNFSPQGVSGIIVISESHFAIHTWPEYSYSAVDLFSCSDFMFKDALRHIRDQFESEEYFISEINRGLPELPEASKENIILKHITI